MRRWLRGAAFVLGTLLVLAAAPLPAPILLDEGDHIASAAVWRAAEATRPTVYLTFDAGNAPDETVEPLLELLGKEDVRATFFLTGRWTLLHPSAARAIAGDGHLLANHGFNHFHAEVLPAPVKLAEVWWAEEAITLVCGEMPTRLYRPPHGGTDEYTEAYLASHGFRTVMWSKNPSDWREDGSVTVEGISSAIMPLEDGDIVVCHLRNDETVEALRDLIPALRREGFTFGVLDAHELLMPTAQR